MSEERRLSREWDEASNSWSEFVRSGKDFFRDEMNNPAAFRIIGNVKGKRVLDLCCGEGNNTRLLAKRGAIVIGVDFSERMIRLAKRREKMEKLRIRYSVSDAADLKRFKSGSFDLVVCLMALMDVKRYEGATREVARVLKKGGRFVFSITHPCFEFGLTVDGESLGDWKFDEEDEGSEVNEQHLEVRNYFRVGKGEVRWNMERLVKPFRTTMFHRTLTDYFRPLRASGFVVSRLVEPRPTAKGVAKFPSLKRHQKVPHSIVIEAVRT